MKRIVSYLCIVALLVGIVLNQSAKSNNTPIFQPQTKYFANDMQEVYMGTSLSGEDCPLFMSIKPYLPSGTVARNIKGFGFNFRLFRDFGLVVYGSPISNTNQGSNDFKPHSVDPSLNTNGPYYTKGGVHGEYRYHGFKADGTIMSNQ